MCDLCVEHRVDLLAPKRSMGEHMAVGAIGAVAAVHSAGTTIHHAAENAVDRAVDRVTVVPRAFVAGVAAGAMHAAHDEAL